MPNEWFMEFEKSTKDLISITRKDLDPCLLKLKSIKGRKINCDLYLIRCTTDSIRERDFIDIIGNFIIEYALNKNEYADRSPKNLWNIVHIAKDRFRKSSPSGEIGELILFSLLESQRNAPQILNKMALKTDGNMHYHGLDGIHIGIHNNEMILYYGESKFYKKINPAIDKAISDLDKFNESLKDRKMEINLISNFIDKTKFDGFIDEIVSFLNPYEKDKSKLREVYAIFIGFNWSSIEEIDFDYIERDLQLELEKCLLRNSKKIMEKCKSSIKTSNLNNTVEFFFIPFRDVEHIRKLFEEKIS